MRTYDLYLCNLATRDDSAIKLGTYYTRDEAEFARSLSLHPEEMVIFTRTEQTASDAWAPYLRKRVPGEITCC
jgi:hypothetical protein